MNIGTLWAEIGLNTTKLDTGAKKAKATILSLDQIAKRANQSMSSHFGDLGIRSAFDIGQEKQKLLSSFNAIKASGTSTARDISVAQAAVNKRFKELDMELKGGVSSFGQLAGAAKTFGIVLGAAAVVKFGKSVFDAGVQIDSMRKALTAATGSANAAKIEMGFIRSESERLGLNLPTAANGFTKLSAAAKGTSLAGKDVRKIFSAVSASSSKLGLTAEETSGALLAISQMMSKGKVSAEELRQQLGERLPGAFQAAAKAMGVSTAKLDEMLAKGEIMAEDFLPKFADALNDTFGNTANEVIDSARANVNRLGNAWLDLKIAMADSGFMDGVIHSIEALTNAARTAAGWLEKIESFQDKFHSIPGFEHFGGIVKMTEQDAYQMLQHMRDMGSTQEEINKMRREYIKMGIMSEPGPASPHSFGYVPTEKSKNPFGKKTEGSTLPEEADKVVKALQFELEQLGRTEEAQRIYNELKQAGVDINSAAGQQIKSLVEDITRENAALDAHKEKLEAAEAAKEKIDSVTEALQFELDQLGRSEEAQRLYNELKRAGVDANSEAGLVIAGLVERINEENAALEKNIEMKKEEAKAAEEAKRAKEAAADVVDNLRFERDQLARTTEEQRLYNELRKAGVDLNSETGQTIRDLVNDINAQTAALEDSEEATNNMKDAAKDLGMTFSSAFEDAIVSGEKLSDILQGLYEDILRLAVRNMITEPLASGLSSIFSSFGGMISGGIGSIFSSGTSSVASTATSSLAGTAYDPSNYTGIFGGNTKLFAEGGDIREHVIGVGQSTGDVYHIGEKGPETVTPGVGGVNQATSANVNQSLDLSLLVDVEGGEPRLNARFKRQMEDLVRDFVKEMI